jgi:Condensation domain/Thioesterase domain/Phosphopantetheine attachment site
LTGALIALGKRHNLTLGTLAHGAWALVLSRYSGRKKVLFGSSASGRPSELDGVESMVGLFSNTLPIPVCVSDESAVLSWLQALQDQLLDLRKYQHSSLADIHGWSALRRDQAMFESLLAFENYPVDATLRKQGLGLKIRNVRFIEQTNYPLVLTIVPDTEIAVIIACDTQRFDANTIARIFGDIARAFKAMVEAPDMPVAALPILTTGEHSALPCTPPSAAIVSPTSPSLPLANRTHPDAPLVEQATADSQRSYVAPRNPTEEILAVIWSRILGLKRIGIRDNFFEFGARSISAVRVVSEVSRTFDVNLGIATLFRHPTIEQMAQVVARLARARKIVPSVVQLSEGSARPAVYFVYAGVHEHRIAQMVDGHQIFGIDVPLRSDWHNAAEQNHLSELPTMEELIAPYLDALCRHVGSSPCILAGYCFAGVMAFELTRQFQKRGGKVEKLILIDAAAGMLAAHEVAWRHLRRAWEKKARYRRRS